MPLRVLSGVTAAIALLVCVYPAQAQDQRSDTLAYYRVDLAKLPIPEPSTAEVMGYPAVTADKRVVVMLLRNKSFGELDRYFNGIQDGVKRRIQLEYDWVDASRAFDTADSTLGPLLDGWVAAAPTSSHARAARATWNLARAWHVRGEGFASTVSGSAMRQMAELAQESAREAVAALQIDSTNFIAVAELLNVNLLAGDRERGRSIFDAGRRIFPGSYYLAHQYLYYLKPRWGGSLELMATFASEMAADSLINPRLRTFLGAVEAERSESAIDAGKFVEGVAHATAALRYGPEFYWQLQRGHARIHFSDNDRGIVDINQALSQRPQYVDALEFHGMAARSSADYLVGGPRDVTLKQAKHDFELILSLDPLNKYSIDGLKDVEFEMKNCPDEHRECGGSQAGPVRVIAAVGRDFWRYLSYLGVATFISVWGFIKWVRNGFWLPGYIHVLAFLALLMICFIQYQWAQTGSPMTLRRWVVIPTLPLAVYFLFIGLGGAGLRRK